MTIHPRGFIGGTLCLLLLLTLAGCVAPASAPTPDTTLPTPAASDSGPVLVPAALIKPLAQAECEALAVEMTELFGGEVARSEAPFKDMITTLSGTACHLELQADGAQAGTLGEATTRLHDMLKAQGWQEDLRYAADGPTGSLLGFRQENRLCMAGVSDEQPLFIITLDCVQQ